MIRRSWMGAMASGSVETMLEEWASSLRDAKGRIRPLFQQERMAASAGLFLDALLGPERRKTGWMRAEAAGDPGPWRQQALLGRATWDADALRDVVRDYVVQTLAEPDAVLVVDETGFLKQGKASCGVGRQYTGSAGKITNCQIGVFSAYVSGKGHVLGVSGAHHFPSWIGKPEVAGTAESIAEDLDPSAWQRLSAGTGTKGERLYEWAYCELADLGPGGYSATWTGLWTRGLLIRRSLHDGELAFFTTWCPAGAGIATLVAVEGRRWAIEDAFETAKTELGLAHNETRSWHGWHRHVSLVMLAFAMLAAIRRRANAPPPPKTLIGLTRRWRTSS